MGILSILDSTVSGTAGTCYACTRTACSEEEGR
jgi:hypothetical protein